MRSLLAVPVLAGVLGACGGGADPNAAGGAPVHRFVSRPDLAPTRVEVRTRAHETGVGYIFVAPKKMRGPGGPMIVDASGEPVWYKPLEFPVQAADFRVQRYRGERVLTWWQGVQPTIGIGVGKFVIADRSYRTIAIVRAGNGLEGDLHEFLLTARGTAYLAAYRKRRADLSGIGGPVHGWVFDNVVQEVDVASGRVLFEWRSLDHVRPWESAQRRPARTASWQEPFDYFHVNSIDVDARGDLLLSARNTSAIYKVRRRDGALVWRLGGRASDFEMDDGTRFAWQHDARWQPDGTITLFDNSAVPKVAPQSRALVLRVDERERAATLVRAYVHPAKLLSPHQGNAQLLANGNLVVGWGGTPAVTEFSPAGRVLFDAKLAVGDTYRAFRFPWSGRPRDRPALSGAREDDDVTLHVSWNGATDVVTWRVSAGARRADMRLVTERPRTGFETKIHLSTAARFLVAEAVDGRGRVLGTSRTIAP